MLLRQLDQISNPPGTGVKQNRDTGKEQPAGKRACLNECRPIVPNPFDNPHSLLIVSDQCVFVTPQSRLPFKLMSPHKLPNYIRTQRKRTHLTQREVAFLLGAKTSAHVCRHERLEQTPNLQTLLAYEILFHTPVRNLFGGVHQDVEQKLQRRIRLLIQKLATSSYSRMQVRKIEMLNELLNEPSERDHFSGPLMC